MPGLRMTTRDAGSIATAVILASMVMPVSAASPKRDIDGIALGMTTEQIVKASRADCRPNKLTDVSCEDARTHDDYKVMMSGGKPSVALAVKRTFCSPLAASVVLSGLLKAYGLRAGASRPNPNGVSFDVNDSVQGNLVTNGGACPTGSGKSYQFTLRDNSLMKLGSGPSSGGQGATP